MGGKGSGRIAQSDVRERIYEIIKERGPIHGYEIYKKYLEEYPAVTLRLVYYHLKVLEDAEKVTKYDTTGEGFVKRKRYVVQTNKNE